MGGAALIAAVNCVSGMRGEGDWGVYVDVGVGVTVCVDIVWWCGG